MATKQIKFLYSETGKTLYARIQQEEGGNWYDDGDGIFKAYAQAAVVSLAEDASVKRKYSWSGGGSVVWPDGRYYVFVFEQVRGSPDDDNDLAAGDGLLPIENDEEVSQDVNAAALATHDGKLDTVNGIVTDTRRIVGNKLTIDEGNSKLQLWNDAGDAVLYEWPLTDRDGGSIVLQGTGPANRGVPA